MDEVTNTYIYCAKKDTSRHHGRVSTYLVETMNGDDKIVARITPMPMVREFLAPHEVALNALKANLMVDGDWVQKARHNRIKAKANPPKGTATNAKTRQPKP